MNQEPKTWHQRFKWCLQKTGYTLRDIARISTVSYDSLRSTTTSKSREFPKLLRLWIVAVEDFTEFGELRLEDIPLKKRPKDKQKVLIKTESNDWQPAIWDEQMSEFIVNLDPTLESYGLDDTVIESHVIKWKPNATLS